MSDIQNKVKALPPPASRNGVFAEETCAAGKRNRELRCHTQTGQVAHGETRAKGAPILAEGASLAEEFPRYPEAGVDGHRGKPVEPARRAIYAHYALPQEFQGEPDVDPADSATVEKIIRKHGIGWARARTGSALTRYRNVWPDLRWYRSQAPQRWTAEYERLLRERRLTNPGLAAADDP
jgi:hypothetical protein